MKLSTAFLSKIKNFDKLFFFLVLVVLFFLYEYQETTFLTPQSVHNWRGSDCASFAMMYYDHGMNFLEPKVYNVLMGEGNAVGECPILYYFIACLYKLFGPHEFIFRFVVLLIFNIGLFSLYNVTKQITKDRFFSFIIPLLLYSSPLIMLFANNYLCDIPSLSLTFIAWDFILQYRENKKQKHFWLSMLFFALAGLLKLNAAISFVALGAIFFIELNGWQHSKMNNIFVHIKNNIIGFVLALLVISFWYWWAIQYNDKYAVSFLGTKTWPGWPIWEITDQNLVSTLAGYCKDTIYMFFQPTYALVLFLLFFVLANRNNLDTFLYNILLLTLVGVILFVFTFFVGIRDNFYYCINLLILPVFIFICSCLIIKNKYPKTWNSIVFRSMIFIFLLININYAKGTLITFYHHGNLHYRLTNEDFSMPKFRTFIDSIGINKTDKVISFPDETPNVSLYLIGRQGWSNYGMKDDDTTTINSCIDSGAKYLIVSNPSILAEPALGNYTGNFVAHFYQMYVYKLGRGQRNTKNRYIRIKTMSRQFVSINNRSLFCSDSASSPQFYLISLGNSNVAIKSLNGEYVSCDKNNNGNLFINSGWLGEWETFQLINQPDGTIALKGVNGKYVSFKPTEGNALRSDADKIGVTETFLFSN